MDTDQPVWYGRLFGVAAARAALVSEIRTGFGRFSDARMFHGRDEDAMVCGTQSHGGPPQSKTLARGPMTDEVRGASWSAPAFWRFGRKPTRDCAFKSASRPMFFDSAWPGLHQEMMPVTGSPSEINTGRSPVA